MNTEIKIKTREENHGNCLCTVYCIGDIAKKLEISHRRKDMRMLYDKQTRTIGYISGLQLRNALEYIGDDIKNEYIDVLIGLGMNIPKIEKQNIPVQTEINFCHDNSYDDCVTDYHIRLIKTFIDEVAKEIKFNNDITRDEAIEHAKNVAIKIIYQYDKTSSRQR